MEREPAVLTDEGNPDVYLQHAIHSRLNRPSSLPVFHTGPRPHLPSPFHAPPYHFERKYQSDIFKQQSRQSEFLTGDPFIMTQPHAMHHTHHSSPKLSSPQFIGELHREAGVAFQHAPFTEPKPFVNERTITDYSPLSLKCSPLFPHDIPFPYEDRQLSPYPKESHNSHVFSPFGNFAGQPYKSGTERNLHPVKSSFCFEKLQSRFHPSPLEVTLQGNVNSRSESSEILSANKRPIDTMSGYFEEGHSFVNGQRHDRSQGGFQTLDSGHFRGNCTTSFQDHELQRYYHLPLDRQKGTLTSHELNQTRKSVICISSKEDGTTACKKDLQASTNQLKSYATRMSPMDFLPVNRMMGAEPSREIPHYLVPSPSKISHFAAPNLFESMFNLRENRNQSLGSRSTQQSANAQYDLFQNGGYSLKTFKEKFLVNNIEKEDHAEQVSSKTWSEPPREMTSHKGPTCYEEDDNTYVANLKSKGSIEETITQFAGNHMNGNHTEGKSIYSTVNDSMHELASIQEGPADCDKAVDEHGKYLEEADKENSVVKENSVQSELLEEESVGDFSTVLDATELRNEDVTELRNDTESVHDDNLQHNVEPEIGEKDRGKYCDKGKGMEIDNCFEDHQDEEGETIIKNKGADFVEAKSMGSNEDLDREATEEEFSPEETAEDPVVKRVLSREERAIQYAVEKFKEMEEKELTPRTGKRRGRGKKEVEKQSKEDVKVLLICSIGVLF